MGFCQHLCVDTGFYFSSCYECTLEEIGKLLSKAEGPSHPHHTAVKGALCVLSSTSCHPQQFLHRLWCEGLPSVSLIYMSSMTNDRDLFLHPQALYISVSKISPTLMLIFIV